MKRHRASKLGTCERRSIKFIKFCGVSKWSLLPRSEVVICGENCPPRSFNQRMKPFTEAEEDLLIKLHSLLGNRWALIAGRLPDRTENEVKTYWNSNIKTKLCENGNISAKIHKTSLSITQTLDEAQVSDATSGLEEDVKATPGLNLNLSMSISSSFLLDTAKKVKANTFDHSTKVETGNTGNKTLLLFQ